MNKFSLAILLFIVAVNICDAEPISKSVLKNVLSSVAGTLGDQLHNDLKQLGSILSDLKGQSFGDKLSAIPSIVKIFGNVFRNFIDAINKIDANSQQIINSRTGASVIHIPSQLVNICFGALHKAGKIAKQVEYKIYDVRQLSAEIVDDYNANGSYSGYLSVYNSVGRYLLRDLKDIIHLDGQIADILSIAVHNAQKLQNQPSALSGTIRPAGGVLISVIEMIGQALAQLLDEVDEEIESIVKSFDVSSVSGRNSGTSHEIINIDQIVYNSYKFFGQIADDLKAIYNSVLLLQKIIPAISILPSD